jgi:hypothetical protein
MLVVARVDAAARGARERHLFRAILGNAYEKVLELEVLYGELPAVLDDDVDAIAAFRSILDRGVERAAARGAPLRVTLNDLAFKPLPDGGELPCRPQFLIKPSTIYLVTLGIDRIANGDADLGRSYRRGLFELWNEADHLEAIGRTVLRPGNGRDAIRDVLRLIARDIPGWRSSRTPEGEPRGFIPPPNGDGRWPPPSPEPFPLPPLPPKGAPPEICDLVEDLCRWLVVGGVSSLVAVPGPSTYIDGITGIAPKTACQNAQVTISGSGFGTTQPADVDVVIGSTVAPVVSWSDKAIVITVPAGAGSGCIAFRNRTLEAQRVDAYFQNNEAMASISEGLACLGQGGFWPKAPLPRPSVAPCTVFNYLAIGPPQASLNAASSQVTPGTPVILMWSVDNATSFRIRRTSANGPFVDVVDPAGTSLTLSAFIGTQDADATYELTANNSCGTTTRTVTVRLRQPPALRIMGVEVVQAIQRFNFADATQQNTIRLVSRKRTVARVYVDSGITNGFDNGAGADVQPNVRGSVTVFPPGATGMPTTVLNTGGVLAAQPASAVNRDTLDHSLNFALPASVLDGACRLEVRVWVQGHENELGTGWSPFGTSATVIFQPRRAQPVVRILVRDTNQNIGPPTTGNYATSLQGARTRYPVQQAGGLPIFIAPGFETIDSNHDLQTRAGWDDLLDDIADIADGFQDNGELWTAVVPDQSNYNLNGLGTLGGTQPHLLARAALPATFAHELGHNFGLNHSNCGLPAGETPDSRLMAATEDTGFDVGRGIVIPSGTSELMSYCTPSWTGATRQDRWPSITFWDIVFDALP